MKYAAPRQRRIHPEMVWLDHSIKLAQIPKDISNHKKGALTTIQIGPPTLKFAQIWLNAPRMRIFSPYAEISVS